MAITKIIPEQITDTFIKQLSLNNGAITYADGSGTTGTLTIHNRTDAQVGGTAGATAATSGRTIDIPYIKYDTEGHIMSSGVRTHTVVLSETVNNELTLPDLGSGNGGKVLMVSSDGTAIAWTSLPKYAGSSTAGGSATTALTVSATAETGSVGTLVSGTMAGHDYFRIAIGDASNIGYAELATADSANASIYARQYSDKFKTIKRTAEILDASGNTKFPGSVTATGGFIGNLTGTASAAYYSDYAEWFPRGEATEKGDIIALDEGCDHEAYVKATNKSCCVVGIHSEDFGFSCGGCKDIPDDTDEREYNMKNYIPVALAGRVPVKFTGKAYMGCKVVPSDIAGVGRAYNPACDSRDMIVGYLVEADSLEDSVRLLKLKVK